MQCYAESGPWGDHGSMSDADWRRVLDEAVAMDVEVVQFIGGEPTLHAGLADFVTYALASELLVEVYTNLVHVTDELWDVFAQPGVSLATSYYSDDPAQHAAITRRPSHARTKGNVAEAVRRGIPLRAGVIDLGSGQRAAQAQTELVDLGVPAVGYDQVRQVGRGVRDQGESVEQLCGRCGDGVAAISPDGEVWPCVFSRWLPMGNVLDVGLAEILSSSRARETVTSLQRVFQSRGTSDGAQGCQPRCSPNCNPINCGPRCGPMTSPCAPKQCSPADQFCSPNYPGPSRRCSPRTDSPCRPMQCRPTR
ncbi:radical SAM protein [Amycolatopsis roodepoortensis]|uniref:radical SAM protein n=1 Tax=Amycolatopsis roodepoortensis TaxID=700274 RepID=UPI00214ADCB3|nr:radical SAM protein [Amycolatopsis roodepoortensis]UUV36492.1 radical SAM protein [Amycolatopsis roodepoortensis]